MVITDVENEILSSKAQPTTDLERRLEFKEDWLLEEKLPGLQAETAHLRVSSFLSGGVQYSS